MKKKRVKKNNRGKKSKVKRENVSAKIKLLAMTYPDMTAADAASGLERPIAELIADDKKAAAAWERGRFLRSISELAGTAVTISEAENSLEMQPGQLKKIIETDAEVLDLWNSQRLAVTVAIKKAMVGKAIEGKAAAIKQIEHLLINEIAGRGKEDFSRISITQLCDLTGKTRQTVHEWFTKHGLSRNSDKTFSLYEFLPWLENFILTKKADAPGRPTIKGFDPLRDARAAKLQAELDRQKGTLLERSTVIAGLMARHQTLVNTMDRKAEELAALCNNRPLKKITEVVKGFFDDLRRQQCTIPDMLQLPPEAERKLRELFEEIAG